MAPLCKFLVNALWLQVMLIEGLFFEARQVFWKNLQPFAFLTAERIFKDTERTLNVKVWIFTNEVHFDLFKPF